MAKLLPNRISKSITPDDDTKFNKGVADCESALGAPVEISDEEYEKLSKAAFKRGAEADAILPLLVKYPDYVQKGTSFAEAEKDRMLAENFMAKLNRAESLVRRIRRDLVVALSEQYNAATLFRENVTRDAARGIPEAQAARREIDLLLKDIKEA